MAALAMTAKPDGRAHVRLDGDKTWISNGGIADHYVVFARTGEAPGARGLSAFVVDADAPGLSVAERIEVIAPHPLAPLALRRRARAGLATASARRRGLQGRDGDARHFPLDRRRGGARLCPPRSARDRVERAATRQLFGAPLGDLADDPSRDRRQRHRGRCRRAAGLPRRLDQGLQWRRARHPRGGDGQDVCDRSGATRDRSRRATATAAMASPRASRSKSSTGKSGRCASTRAQPKCRRSSSPARC